jgi:hypothetical protein
MPLALPGRTKDAVVVVPASADWRQGVLTFLRNIGGGDARIRRHLALLEERAAGSRPWLQELAGRTLPNGRPMPLGRAYAELLVAESALPLYDAGGFPVSLDLHNPGNEAGVSWYDPEVVEIALVADQGAFTGESFDAAGGMEQLLAKRAERGARLGDLVAELAEQVQARFSYVDVGPTGAVVTSASSPTAVVHPAGAPLRPADFLWSITLWGPELLQPGFEARLEALRIEDAQLAKIGPHLRPHVRLEERRLGYGARMLQFRFLFGTEQRGERVHLDSPLAERLGLRSTNLQYRG